MKKRITALLLAAALTALLFSAAGATEAEASVTLDGRALAVRALVDGQSVALPLRDVCEALGYRVDWSDAGGVRKVTVTKGRDTVVFDLTHRQVTDNGHTFSAVTNAGRGLRIVSDRTYIETGLLSTVFPFNADFDTQRTVVTLESRAENSLSVKTEKLSSETAYLSAALQYPQLDGLADAAAQSAVNAVLKRAAQASLETGEKNASAMATSIRDGYTGALGKCETVFDYVVTFDRDGLFSVVLMDYQYAGGAHGGTVQTAYTFDLATGKSLSLSDLMDRTSDYTSYLSASVRREIDRRVEAGDLYEFDFAPFSAVGPDPLYYLSSSAVVLYFQEYEHFPYAAGIQEFTVPFDELGTMLAAPYAFLGGTVTILEEGANNALSVGGIGRVVLDGNPTTGYSWHVAVSDDSVLRLINELYVPSGDPERVGAGGTYVWNLKAVKSGTVTVTFRYYRDWEDEGAADTSDTRVYRVSVL